MTSKIARMLLLIIIAGHLSAADWRSEVANFFSDDKPNDYRAAAVYLQGVFGSLSDEDKPVACGLQAFLSRQLGDKESEYQKLGEYFEKYGAIGMGFNFLPLSAQANVFRYLREWQLKYPWVLKIGFVVSAGPAALSPSVAAPETIILGFEMASDVYYKLSDGRAVIKGGQFRRGFNSISLETWTLLRESGAYPYILEFKAGDLMIRRELIIGVELDTLGMLRTSAASAKKIEFVLKMYLGDALLASSQKSLPSAPGMGIKLPPPNGVYDPFGPGYQNEPKIPNTFPILAVPAVIYDLVKKLFKGEEVEPVPPVELKTDLAVSYKSKNASGKDTEVRARLSLGMKSISFIPFSSTGKPS